MPSQSPVFQAISPVGDRSGERQKKGEEEDATYLGIIHVVDLVKDHELNVSNEISSLVEHASKDFGRHLESERGRSLVSRYSARFDSRLCHRLVLPFLFPSQEQAKTGRTIRQLPSGLICTSPVRIPIVLGSKVCLKSRNF